MGRLLFCNHILVVVLSFSLVWLDGFNGLVAVLAFVLIANCCSSIGTRYIDTIRWDPGKYIRYIPFLFPTYRPIVERASNLPLLSSLRR